MIQVVEFFSPGGKVDQSTGPRRQGGETNLRQKGKGKVGPGGRVQEVEQALGWGRLGARGSRGVGCWVWVIVRVLSRFRVRVRVRLRLRLGLGLFRPGLGLGLGSGLGSRLGLGLGVGLG